MGNQEGGMCEREAGSEPCQANSTLPGYCCLSGGYAPLCLFISFFFSFLFFLLSLPLKPGVLKMSSLFCSGKRRWGHSFHEQTLFAPRVQMKQHWLTSLHSYTVQILQAANCNPFGRTSRSRWNTGKHLNWKGQMAARNVGSFIVKSMKNQWRSSVWNQISSKRTYSFINTCVPCLCSLCTHAH